MRGERERGGDKEGERERGRGLRTTSTLTDSIWEKKKCRLCVKTDAAELQVGSVQRRQNSAGAAAIRQFIDRLSTIKLPSRQLF